MHQGVPPSATIWSVSLSRSSMLGNFISRFLEIPGHIPDERLHVGLEGESEIGLVAVLALITAEIDPGFTRAVIFLDPFGRVVAERHKKTLGGEIGEKARLRQNGNIGRRAGLCVDDDLLLVVFRRGITDIHARRVSKIGEYGLEQSLVLTTPRAENRQRLAFKVSMGRFEIFVAFPVELGVLARREFQIGGNGRTRQQHD